MSEYLVKSSAPNLVNHGMVYRLGTFPPEEQLAFLDQVGRPDVFFVVLSYACLGKRSGGFDIDLDFVPSLSWQLSSQSRRFWTTTRWQPLAFV
jgi:hypothetical protein